MSHLQTTNICAIQSKFYQNFLENLEVKKSNMCWFNQILFDPSFQTYPFCPQNGGFSDWSTWSECDCHDLVKRRERKCDNPAPRLGGATCKGKFFEISSCDPVECSTSCPRNSTFTTCGTCPMTCQSLSSVIGCESCSSGCECDSG